MKDPLVEEELGRLRCAVLVLFVILMASIIADLTTFTQIAQRIGEQADRIYAVEKRCPN